jgi:predicted ABC-type ATPase
MVPVKVPWPKLGKKTGCTSMPMTLNRRADVPTSKPRRKQSACESYVYRCVAPFTFETDLSTGRNIDLLYRAKAAEFHIESVFVLTSDPELNVFRVKSRELSGGHSVPLDKIRSRYARSLANISKLLALSDVFRLVDNTAQPEILFIKDEAGQQIHSNRYWTVEGIEKLCQYLKP